MQEHRVVPVFLHGVKSGSIHEILKYWILGSKNHAEYRQTGVKTESKTEIFPLCRTRAKYGELPEEFQHCIKKDGQSERKCIDSVVLQSEAGVGMANKSTIANH